MEESKKWSLAVVVVAVVALVVFATVGYMLVREDDEETKPPSAVMEIGGSGLRTSEFVDHGSGTSSDPYVINGLDIELNSKTATTSGIIIAGVHDHLIVSGIRIHADYIPPGYGYSNSFTGISMTWCTNVTILDCRFENLSMGIELRYSAVNISYNTFASCRLGVLIDEGSSQWTVGGIAMSGNNFLFTDYCVEAIGDWDFITVADVLMKNNTMKWYQRAVGLFGKAQNFNIQGNNFYDGSGFAIEASMLLGSNIIENAMFGMGNGGGISLSDSKEVRIERNLIGTGGPAIDVESSENITISNNTIDTYMGISRPMQFGLVIVDSKYVNATYNKISDRTVGVIVLSSSPSSSEVWVHHNGFVNNGVQALDTSAMQNQWDDGAGSGNYWTNYHGSDDDHDGIGDTPYTIDSDTWDNYPLMVMPV
jgi:nitrous oxidase accessory protein NosD